MPLYNQQDCANKRAAAKRRPLQGPAPGSKTASKQHTGEGLLHTVAKASAASAAPQLHSLSVVVEVGLLLCLHLNDAFVEVLVIDLPASQVRPFQSLTVDTSTLGTPSLPRSPPALFAL